MDIVGELGWRQHPHAEHELNMLSPSPVTVRVRLVEPDCGDGLVTTADRILRRPAHRHHASARRVG